MRDPHDPTRTDPAAGEHTTHAETSQLADHVHVPLGSIGRRGFLRVAGLGAAASTLPACDTPPPEDLVPYVRRPPELTPGRPVTYATAAFRGPYAVGLLGETREGRPIKLTGHPEHPASLGATGVAEQALVRSCYDRDRLAGIRSRPGRASWRQLLRHLHPDEDDARRWSRAGGEGLHVWLERTTSPWIAQLLTALRVRHPRVVIHWEERDASAARRVATTRLFGRPLEPHVDLRRVDCVLALDADYLTEGPSALRHARHLGPRHAPDADGTMPRLYSVETMLTPTGALADHRCAVKPSEVLAIARGILQQVGRSHRPNRGYEGAHANFVAAVAADLRRHQGRSAVLVGDRQPAVVHALGALINDALDNAGSTVTYRRTPVLEPETPDRETLEDALDTGAVEELLVLAPNPLFTGPRRLSPALLRRARSITHLAPHRNETAAVADWVVPARHGLERWGDARSHDGTYTFVQPLVRPLVPSWSPEALLAVLLGDRRPDPRVRFEAHYETSMQAPLAPALERGFVEGSRFPAERASLNSEAAATFVAEAEAVVHEGGPLEVSLAPDPRIGDGRDANNPWLLELPEPVTKLVWDNAALLGPATARAYGIETNDVVRVTHDDARIEAPAYVMPALARDVVVLWRGWGQARAAGHVGAGVGVDVGPLYRHPGQHQLTDARIEKTGRRVELVTTQQHGAMWAEPIRARRLREWRDAPPPGGHGDDERAHRSIYPHAHRAGAHESGARDGEPPPQWGMAIDLSACTGCSACVIACQAENNIPVVGKDQVRMGREMHWMRIDRYFGYLDDPFENTPPNAHDGLTPGGMLVQPMLCQHCEQAPCEYVCPVHATVHSPDGLNEMVYNRCVGTRFCSNNCPWKVRRFNFFEYNGDAAPIEELVHNPDVTVRARGVMEKCTFCVQRLRRAGIESRLTKTPLADLDVRTACEEACPTHAITFGLVSERSSAVYQKHQDPRAYASLEHLGTRPRVRYLTRIRHVNEELEE